MQTGNPVRRAGKTALIIAQLRLGKAGTLVEHRQQGESQPRLCRSIGHSPGHGGRVGVGRAVFAVLQVMEFTHLGVAALQHFHIQLGCYRLQLRWCDAQGHAIHAVAPGPEVIGIRGTPFRQAGKGTLEGVAVRIHHAGQHRAG